MTPGEVQGVETGDFQDYKEQSEESVNEEYAVYDKENQTESKQGEETDRDVETEMDKATEPDIFVYVCGAVLNPGVYKLEAGSRVFQAVELAGGFLEDAYPEYVNQAMLVADGQQIYIPRESDVQNGEVFPPESVFLDGMDQENAGKSLSGKVNINTAAKTELMTISGVGESRAQDIIEYREAHGGFSSIEEIMNVPGIKEATFEKIKDGIKVN